jgi:hypothetical protein
LWSEPLDPAVADLPAFIDVSTVTVALGFILVVALVNFGGISDRASS